MIKIAFEGLDGSGKTTVAKEVVEKLLYEGHKVAIYHEPRTIRDTIFEHCKLVGKVPYVNDAFTSYLFSIDAFKNRVEEIQDNYPIIIRDRDTTISQYAYHHDLGTQDEFTYAMAALVNMVNGLDVCIFVDISVETAIARIQSRAPQKAVVDYFEKAEKLKKIYSNYHELLHDNQKLNWMGHHKVQFHIISNERPIEETIEEAYNIVKNNIGSYNV